MGINTHGEFLSVISLLQMTSSLWQLIETNLIRTVELEVKQGWSPDELIEGNIDENESTAVCTSAIN